MCCFGRQVDEKFEGENVIHSNNIKDSEVSKSGNREKIAIELYKDEG